MELLSIVLLVFLIVEIVAFGGYVIRDIHIPEAAPLKNELFPYSGPIKYYAEENGIPLDIFVNLLQSESGLDPSATGRPNGDGSIDMGIAQLNGRYLTYFSKKYAGGNLDPYDPLQAIPVAARYLHDLADLFGGCWACAIAAYKMGPTKLLELHAEKAALPRQWVNISGEHGCGGD